jgi:hypothetical protein
METYILKCDRELTKEEQMTILKNIHNVEEVSINNEHELEAKVYGDY